MWRSIASNALTLLIVLLIGAGAFVAWAQSQYAGEGPLEEAICLRVAPGSNFNAVSRELAERGAISSPQIFRVGADYADKADQLKAGSFLVPANASMSEIVDIVTVGGQSTCGTEIVYRIGVTSSQVEVRELDPSTNRYVERAEFSPGEDPVPEIFTQMRARQDTRYRVAVAEGATSWQVVEGLKAVDVLEGELPGVPEEGILAPDSYEVRVGTERQAVIDQMADRQAARLEEAWRNRVDDLPIDTPEEALILASLIEKETGGADERGLVASVFVNRLEQGMRLQTDPTVIYGITNGVGTLGRGIRQSELRAETPYNTYVINGLPPTPIANPGLASIEAAVNPAESDYIFFVAKTLNPADGHNFAETLEEHNRNVAAYRALEQSQ